MKQNFFERLRWLESSEFTPGLLGIKRGFEKESLRIDNNGFLAKTRHPVALGSSLTHPRITTDFSEAQLELITPPFTGLDEPVKCLTEIHQFTYSVLQNELLWPGSMPCFLPGEEEIPIAEFGNSNLGQLKQIYRRGLGYRYGKVMQTISGVHYNFSLPLDFWEKYHQLQHSSLPLSLFISEQYLGMVRNSLRYSWILPLLFGASPAVCSSFLKNHNPNLTSWGKNTLINLDATSLRLSDLGYQNKIQSKIAVSFNSLTEYLTSLQQETCTSYPPYQQIGVKVGGEYRQLSDSVFQIEDEFYSLVRPKRVSEIEERMLIAIRNQGIEYLEIRALDLNPFEPIGLDTKMIYLLDLFLIFCLLSDSPALEGNEVAQIHQNVQSVALMGQQPQLILMDGKGNSKGLLNWAKELIEKLEAIATLLDNGYQTTLFTDACRVAMAQCQLERQSLSARILQEMQENKESYLEFALRWGKKHQAYFKELTLSSPLRETYNVMARESFEAKNALENSNGESFDTYLQRYLQS